MMIHPHVLRAGTILNKSCGNPTIITRTLTLLCEPTPDTAQT